MSSTNLKIASSQRCAAVKRHSYGRSIISRLKERLEAIAKRISNEDGLDEYIREISGVKIMVGGCSGITRTLQRIANSPHFSPSQTTRAPYGYFYNRPVIGDGSPIHGGIFLSPEIAEAIVIDESYGTLGSVFTAFRGCLPAVIENKVFDDRQLLQFTADFVRRIFVQDPSNLSDLNFTLRANNDRKVALDAYISAHCGGTRHQVLLAGYLLENLQKRGGISGYVGIDTSNSLIKLTYTASTGEIFFLDFSRTNERKSEHRTGLL